MDLTPSIGGYVLLRTNYKLIHYSVHYLRLINLDRPDLDTTNNNIIVQQESLLASRLWYNVYEVLCSSLFLRISTAENSGLHFSSLDIRFG